MKKCDVFTLIFALYYSCFVFQGNDYVLMCMNAGGMVSLVSTFNEGYTNIEFDDVSMSRRTSAGFPRTAYFVGLNIISFRYILQSKFIP